LRQPSLLPGLSSNLLILVTTGSFLHYSTLVAAGSVLFQHSLLPCWSSYLILVTTGSFFWLTLVPAVSFFFWSALVAAVPILLSRSSLQPDRSSLVSLTRSSSSSLVDPIDDLLLCRHKADPLSQHFGTEPIFFVFSLELDPRYSRIGLYSSSLTTVLVTQSVAGDNF